MDTKDPNTKIQPCHSQETAYDGERRNETTQTIKFRRSNDFQKYGDNKKQKCFSYVREYYINTYDEWYITY